MQMILNDCLMMNFINYKYIYILQVECRHVPSKINYGTEMDVGRNKHQMEGIRSVDC